MTLDRKSIDDAARYLSEHLGQEINRERVLQLGSDRELAVGAFVEGERVFYLNPGQINCFRSDSRHQLPVGLSGAFPTVEEALLKEGEPGYFDGWRDTLPGQQRKLNDIVDIFVPTEQLERHIALQLERQDVPAGEDGATGLVIEELSGEGDALPTASAREVGKQKTIDYWEGVVHPVYDDVKLQHPGKKKKRLIAMVTEKRLIKQGCESRDFDTIRTHARDHGW